MRKVLLVVSVVIGFALATTSCGDAADKAKDSVEVVADKAGEAAEAVKEKAEEAVEEVKAVLANVDKGKEIYDTKCMACHMTGVTGAPKMDEKERWVTIAAQGLDVLYEHSIKGFTGEQGNMPAKGGFTDLTDDDMKNAVSYMLKTSGAM
jgi:cytochrome c5